MITQVASVGTLSKAYVLVQSAASERDNTAAPSALRIPKGSAQLVIPGCGVSITALGKEGEVH